MHRPEYPDQFASPLDWMKHEIISELVIEFQARAFASYDVFTVADMLQYVREGEPRAEQWVGCDNVFSTAAEIFYAEFFQTRPWLATLPADDSGKPRFQRNDTPVVLDDYSYIGLPFWPFDFRESDYRLSDDDVGFLISDERLMFSELVDQFVDEMVEKKVRFSAEDMATYFRSNVPPLRWLCLDEYLAPDELENFENACFEADFLDSSISPDDEEGNLWAFFQANGKPSTVIDFLSDAGRV
jgi:hypothetical protein